MNIIAIYRNLYCMHSSYSELFRIEEKDDEDEARKSNVAQQCPTIGKGSTKNDNYSTFQCSSPVGLEICGRLSA